MASFPGGGDRGPKGPANIINKEAGPNLTNQAARECHRYKAKVVVSDVVSDRV